MKTTSKLGSILLSVCELIVGILLLVNPDSFTKVVLICLGAVFLVLGLVSIIQYFRTPAVEAALEQRLVRGLIELLLGVFCIASRNWILDILPAFTVLYGIATLIVGLRKVQWFIDLLRIKARRWILAMLSAILTLVFAVVILCNPFASAVVFWNFIAITFIVEAVVDIIAALLAKAEKAE